MSRAFLCLELDEAIVTALTRFVDPLRELPGRVAWSPPTNWHITVKYLGETDPRRFTAIGANAQSIASQFPEFTLQVAGAGVFPNWHAPRVLWVGVEDPTPTLHTMVEALELSLEHIGIREELQPYQPHVTIGRVREAYPLTRLQRALARAPAFGMLSVKWLTLMRSDLTPLGSRYSPVARYPFASMTRPSNPTNGTSSAHG